MKPLDRVLDTLKISEGPNGRGEFVCFCPGHDDRNTPNLHVGEAPDGTVRLWCSAGCSQDRVLVALEERGVSRSALFPKRNGYREGGESYPSGTRGTVKPCTLGNYGEAKRLPVEFLRGLGMSDISYLGSPAVRIPYLDAAGSEEICTRFRVSILGRPNVKTKSGNRHRLYGLWKLDEAREAGYAVLVEGESDCHTLWYHGIPELGIPGANGWKSEWASELDGIGRLYFVVEDGAGEQCWESLAASPACERLYRVELDGFKDASEVHIADPGGFRERFDTALKGAVSWLDIAECEALEGSREAWARCEELAHEQRILARFAQEVSAHGLAGEERVAKILFLAMNSRHLPARQLVNVVVKGPSSAGKSFIVESVLRFFPDDAYHLLTAMSEKALAYSEEPLAHRFLVIAEAVSMSGEWANYLIRSLLSEGQLRYETVEKTGDGLRPRIIEREGPTGLIATTTRVRLHDENETRMLTVNVDDTPAHTREVLRTLAADAPAPPQAEEWHALQVWLEGSETRVVIPYAMSLAEMVPTVAVRLRRDFGAVLNLIRSHALLHRATRERDDQGRIVATLEDYTVVRDLVADIISEGLEATVSEIVRETVGKVDELTRKQEEPVTMAEVGRALNLDKNATYRRVQRAIEGGYVKNLEDRKGRPARLVIGDPMPEDREVLPEPQELMDESGGFRVSKVSEGTDTPLPTTPVNSAPNTFKEPRGEDGS
jgi:hypothetical protein